MEVCITALFPPNSVNHFDDTTLTGYVWQRKMLGQSQVTKPTLAVI